MNVDQDQWTRVDEFLCQSLFTSDPVLEAAIEASAAAGLPSIQVSPCQGKLLQILAQLQESRTILEIGTLGGYSTIWLARALPPNGRLITLEVNQKYAQVAALNSSRAKLSKLVGLRIGPALETLLKLAAEGQGPCALMFIDADKE